MVKYLCAFLLAFSLPALATPETVNSYEVGKMAQKANQAAQQKAARQKSEPDEMLKLLSTFETDAEDEPGLETPQTGSHNQSLLIPAEDSPSASSASDNGRASDTVLSQPALSTLSSMTEKGVLREQVSPSTSPSPSSVSFENQPLSDIENRKVSQTDEATPPSPAKRLPASVYVPPASITPTRATSGRYGAIVRGSEYGILFGRWVRARIEREINSGDSGEVEIVLEEDLAGKYRTIPAGTVIYASKGFNNKTRRLAIQTRRGVTPDNQVIQNIIASAFDNTRRAGLSGFIERNRDEVYQDAAGKALVELASGAVNAVLPAEFSGVTDSVADLESPQGRSVPYTIKVLPQSFWLRIDESL